MDSSPEENDLNLESSTPYPDVPEKNVDVVIEQVKRIVQIRDIYQLEKRRGSSQFDLICHVF